LVTGMSVENILTWIFIVFDLWAVWLLVEPSGLMKLWTANRIPASDGDRLIARLVAAIILGTQVTRWVGQAKGTNAQVIMHWLSIIFGGCAVVFLGYHFVALLLSKPERRTQVTETKWRAVASESDEEAIVRYRAAWQKYRRLRVAFRVLILGWLPFAYIFSAVFRFFHWNINILGAMVLAWIPLMPIVGWQWSFWQCPRCGHAFKGPYDAFFPKCCHHCNLPMFSL
jgi:hypothetical protein